MEIFLVITVIFINLFAFCTYGIDFKRKAKNGAWRIPEKTLLILALNRFFLAVAGAVARYDVLPA